MNIRPRHPLVAALFAAPLALPAFAQPAPAAPPAPLQHVLDELQLAPEQRSRLLELLQRQREEREAALAALRQRHDAELDAVLGRDQRVAVRAALRPPCPPPRGAAADPR